MDYPLLITLMLTNCALILSFYMGIIYADTQSVYVVVLKDPSVSQLLSNVEFDQEIYMPGDFEEEDYALTLTRSHDYMLDNAFGKGAYEKVYSYTYLLNGFSILLSKTQVETLYKHPQVMFIEKDTKFEKLTTYTPTYMGLTKGGAWSKEGGQEHAGEGIVIGVIDTGIDPTHPSFKDNNYPKATQYKGSCQTGTHFPKGSCTNKLVGAQYFAKGAIASGLFNASIHYASPIDGEGHGTHTASTAAGNSGVEVIVDGNSFGLASGMAPRAHVAMYRALYPNIGGTLSDVVAATEQAVKDKVDILSLSIGPGAPPSGVCVYLNVFDMAMLSAVKAGVFVTQAAGNGGPYPLSMGSFSPWICSVAASVHDRSYINSITFGNNQTIEGAGLAAATNAMYSLISAEDASKSTTYGTVIGDCQNASMFEKEMVQGKILMCNYSLDFPLGISSIDNVVHTVQSLSAAGVVMVFIPELVFIANSLQTTTFPVPAIIIKDSDGIKAIWDYYAKAPKSSATAKINGGTTASYSQEAPKVAAYSSRGPNPENNKMKIADILKPNIMAPGSMIWAAWSSLGIELEEFQGRSFALISGTSMATPHIAGIAALLKQKNQNLSPAAICSALTTTACSTYQDETILAQYPSSNTTLALGPGTPFDFGAGEVNATSALDPGIIFDAGYGDYLQFLCAVPGAASAVKNATKISCPSNVGMPTDLNLPSITIANLTTERTFPRQVTNIAEQSETYNVQINQPTGALVVVKPTTFTIAAHATLNLAVTLTAKAKSTKPQFGYIKLLGTQGHAAVLPVSIASISA